MLIAARKRAGLKQRGLGELINRHQSFVSKYEKGESRLEVIEFVEICRAVGVAPDRLIKKLSRIAASAGGDESQIADSPGGGKSRPRARGERRGTSVNRPVGR
jgi:transcriptional regulator with XRE-family HTH domain